MATDLAQILQSYGFARIGNKYVRGLVEVPVQSVDLAAGADPVEPVVGNYLNDLTPASGVFELDVVPGVTLARANLTEDSSIAFGTQSIGGRYKILSDGNGYDLTFPATAQIIRGAYDPFRRNHIEIQVVAPDVQLVAIRTQELGTLLFRHDMLRAGPFTTEAEILSVGTSSSDIANAAKYSILGTSLEAYRRASGSFRFRLVFPTLNEHITWDQTSDFVADADNATNSHVVSGFELISASSPRVLGEGDFVSVSPTISFGGLSWNSEHVDDDPLSVPLFDGFPGIASPYWPIGQAQDPGDSSLLVAFDNGTNTPTDIIELYVIED